MAIRAIQEDISRGKRGIKFRYEDYILFPEDRNRHEIIEGEHYMTPSPAIKHQAISRNLELILATFVARHNLGKIFYAPCDVVLSDTDIVQPDIIFISGDRLHIITELNIQGAPDLVVEIISDASRRIDKVLKRMLYERYGVREYWIIDPVVEILERYILKDDRYQKVGEYQSGEIFSPEIFKELDIDLQKIFEI